MLKKIQKNIDKNISSVIIMLDKRNSGYIINA